MIMALIYEAYDKETKKTGRKGESNDDVVIVLQMASQW